jgi:zinc transport system ATP-binding protein
VSSTALSAAAVPAEAGAVEPVLHLADASFSYGQQPVVHEVSATIGRGEFVVLLGANGSGKSTLVKGLLRQARLTSGTVEIFGTPQAKFRQWYRLGYVPQRATLTGSLPASVREVVSCGRLPRRRWWQPGLNSTDQQAITSAMTTVGVQELGRHRLASLSGGQQRRVLLARALAGQPDVLLLDEPMAGVDLASQEILAQVLADLHTGGTTIVLVAHELGPLANHLQRAIILRQGRIDADVPVSETAQLPHWECHTLADHVAAHCDPPLAVAAAAPSGWLAGQP